MRRNLLIILCIIGVSALVFSQFLGTSANDSGQAAAHEMDFEMTNSRVDAATGEKIIRASIAVSPEEYAVFTRLARQFSSLHEGVTVQVENVEADQAYEIWKKAAQMGEAPDLMLLDNNWVLEFAALGFLQPVGDFFSVDQQDSRISTLMDQVKWNGYIWGVPKDVDPYVMAWNVDAAGEYGFENAPATSQEMLEWNSLMLKSDEGRWGIYAHPSDPYSFIAVTSSLTGAWLGRELSLENELDALRALESFYVPYEEIWTAASYQQNYPLPTEEWEPWLQLADGGIAAMITTVSEFKKHAADNIKIASIPIVDTDEERIVWLKGRSFAVSSRTPYAQLVMDWIKDMTEPDVEIIHWKDSRMLPAQIPTYGLAPLRDDEHIQSFDWLLRQGVVLPAAAETSQMLYELESDLEKMWNGEISLFQLLDSNESIWILSEESKQ